MRVFVSYGHADGAWVLDRLAPVLRASGVEVLIDRERFHAGGSVVGQMDEVQAAADKTVAIVTATYCRSDYCMHELRQAVARDPDCARLLTIPVRRDDVIPPAEVGEALRVELQDEQRVEQWDLLLRSCQAELGMKVPVWLAARDEVVRELERHRSVNLVVRGERVAWRGLLEDLKDHRLPDLGIVDLQNPGTLTRDGLCVETLRSLGLRVDNLLRRPRDLTDFCDKILSLRRRVRVAMTHFDLAQHRRPNYDVDLFATLRWLIMEGERPLALLAQSRVPFGVLLPRGHPLSEIDLTTVDLG